MKVSRRAFLKVTGATAAATVAYRFGAGILIPKDAEGQAGFVQGEKLVNSVCQQCPAGCLIQVKVVDGRAVKIEGNPLSPNNQGKVCPKGQSGLQVLYDPDRIKQPYKRRRMGYREFNWDIHSWDNIFEPIDYDDAIEIVAGKLKELRAKEEPHKFVWMNGRNRGQAHGLIKRFLDYYGSPNDIGHSSICADGTKFGHYLTQGIKSYLGYDWENTNYVLCFGGGFLEAWRPTTHNLVSYGKMRRGREGIRSKIVQIETRFSVTAAKADEWIPINPGTDGALAMGIAHVIIKEKLYDSDYIQAHTIGFEDWTDEKGSKHIGFKTMALADYPPEKVSSITGVPVETIVRLAREFATTRPAIAAGERGASMQTNGIFNRMSIHALNALVGSINMPGGILTQRDPSFKPWPTVPKDEIAAKSAAEPRFDLAGSKQYPLASNVYAAMPERILNSDPYDIQIIFLYYTNPLFSSPNVNRYYEAFKKVPFIVSFSPFMDESTMMADIVLPDVTYLERWHDDTIYPSIGHSHWGIRQPVVEPLYPGTKNSFEVWMDIARAVGGPLAEAFPWRSAEEMIKYRAQGIHEAQRGNIVAKTFDEFWQKLLEIGGWWDPPYPFDDWKGAIGTPSGKFEFYSHILKEKLDKIAFKEAEKHSSSFEEELEGMLQGLKITDRGDKLYMPHYEPPRFAGDEDEYPLTLNTYKLISHAEGRGANQPWLQEIGALHAKKDLWNCWVEINPETAEKLGISDGDTVVVESPVGSITTMAKIYPGAMPNVVNMPYEMGHRYGRWAGNKGRSCSHNPNWIVVDEYDYLGGNVAWFSTRVKVYKKGGVVA